MNKIRFQEIQGILSIGYIYLIVLGILNETLYYNQLGFNILSYSSIIDVLISPISHLTSSVLGFCIFIFMVMMLYYFPKYMVKYKHKALIHKLFGYQYGLSDTQLKVNYFKKFTYMFSLGLLGFFFGTGWGTGLKKSQRIINNDIEYNDKLFFINGNSSSVDILGKNSSYIFYLTPENKTVKVSPISGIIQTIEEN